MNRSSYPLSIPVTLSRRFYRKLCYLPVLLFFISSSQLFGQTKFEREFRVREANVPAYAIQFIDSCGFSSKIKWYSEESSDGKSYEAKTKHKKRLYSIEFDTLGNILDVEIGIKWESIPKTTGLIIHSQLDSTFDSYRFIEIQKQWTGQRNVLIELVRQNITTGDYSLKYEIVVRGKNGKQVDQFEYLFSNQGTLERRSIIIFRNTDNLDY